MPKRSKITGNKRQRERDKRRKRENKDARRQERLEAKEGGPPSESDTALPEGNVEDAGPVTEEGRDEEPEPPS